MNSLLAISILPDASFLQDASFSLFPEWVDAGANLSEKSSDLQKIILESYEKDPEKWLFYLGFRKTDRELSDSINYFIRFSGLFIEKLSRMPDLESLRHRVDVEISENDLQRFIHNLPMFTGSEYINRDLLSGLWDDLLSTFSSLILEHDGSVESFFGSLSPDIHLAGQVFFHLVESRHAEWPFAFMATYSTGMGPDGKPVQKTLKNAALEFDDARYVELLSKVYRTAEKSDLVKELIQTGDLFHPIHWSADEALMFLKEIPLYESTGVLCRIPDWWRNRSDTTGVSINLGDKKPSLVGLDAILDFRPAISVGGVELSKEEAIRILQESEGLAFIKNRWVAVDHEKLKKAIEACDAVSGFEQDGLSIRDAMRLQLSPEKILGSNMDGCEISVSNGQWLESLFEKMQSPGAISDRKPASAFRAKLRDYQQKGLNWLGFMDSVGFGACLADDMGLGKTIQVLAFLSTLKKKGKKKEHASLLIIPASLMSNWLSEIESFFPELICFAAHPDYLDHPQCTGFSDEKGEKNSGNNRSVEKSPDEIDRYDLVITTYALSKKYEWLKSYRWRSIILDEAQAIKNPATKQTLAVKRLKSENRIIMSGTPVENRLADLWSLIDFLNPGLLGNRAEFTRFAKSLSDDQEGYNHLRRVVSPYILRRLKTDRSVISDLPEKVEMKVYAGLTKKQTLLYRNALEDLKYFLKNSSGIERRGIVLSSLMKFKQLCNHPDQFSGTGEYREADSGKFERLREICETIHEKRERVLVFTQFKEMTEPLRHFLESIFNRRGTVIHGSIPAVKRKEIIEEFQAESYCPFMVLSLKAGGVGLNLTRANHVIHFDRWWNPAIENQATDRAFRIGQKKNVIVHKFITKGTIEEKIDKMIEEKKELADKIVSQSGETMITEMGNEELLSLFRLSL